jgi:hypothetical protein
MFGNGADPGGEDLSAIASHKRGTPVRVPEGSGPRNYRLAGFSFVEAAAVQRSQPPAWTSRSEEVR